MWLAISRLHEKWLRFYHRRLFLARIGSREKTLRVAGRVNVFKPLPVHGRKPLVTIGKNVFLHPGVLFDGDGPVSIGDNVFIGKDVILYASAGGGITIGSDVSIAAQTYIIDCDHGMALTGVPNAKQTPAVAPVVIGSDVWIAANCTILKGSTVGDGAVLGAKTLVRGSIPANAVAVGIPARVVKYRTAGEEKEQAAEKAPAKTAGNMEEKDGTV